MSLRALGTAWLLAGLLIASTSARALPADTWLVAVGNDRGDADDEHLLYAERDAELFIQTFEQEGGVSPLKVTQLLGANAEQMRAAIQEINARIRAADPSRPTMLVVYYSGHADAEALHLDGTRLKVEELTNLVSGSPASMRLLVVDACRSGAATKVKGVRAAEPFDVTMLNATTSQGLAIITSSAAGESSQESDTLRGSFFTHHFVNALRGAADENGDGQVTLTEAYAYAYSQTLRSTGRTLSLQHPTYAYDVKGKGEVVLSRPGDASGRVGHLKLPGRATYLVSEKREGGAVVAEVTPVRESTLFALPAGAYFVQERLPSEYREYQVTLAPEGEVALGDLPYRVVRYDRLVRKRGGERRSINGLYLLAGAHGPTLAGDKISPQLILGYGLDLPWLTVGARLRGASSTGDGPDGAIPRRHGELGVALTAQRYLDFEEASVSIGLLAELNFQRETFSGVRDVAPVNARGAGFGGLLSLERHVGGGIALRLEGGPVTYLFHQLAVHNQDETSTAFASPFTWWAAGGLSWRY